MRFVQFLGCLCLVQSVTSQNFTRSPQNGRTSPPHDMTTSPQNGRISTHHDMTTSPTNNNRTTIEMDGEDLLEKFCLTKEEEEKAELKAKEQLAKELSEEAKFRSFDLRVSRANSHIDQHRKFVIASPISVNKGIVHRPRVILIEQSLKLKHVPLPSVKPLLQAGFGPKVFCDDNCTCDINSPYRTADGSCNNLVHVHWGQACIPFRRWLAPIYHDGVSSPRQYTSDGMTFLPSARTVSRQIHESSTLSDLSTDFTHMLMQWGQFLDHDITRTPPQRGQYTGGPIGCCSVLFSGEGIPQTELDARPQCFAIKITSPDPHFTTDCMNFVRSVQVENADCLPAPVEQLNEITAYIDASQLYGSSQKEQNDLRTFVNGEMKVKSVSGKEYLPEDGPGSCNTNTAPNYCFKAGDERVNENPALQSMHTLFLWEHNRIARQLKSINCHWDDEKIFQETRKIVGAIMQEITYDEYLPIILGTSGMAAHGINLAASGYTSNYNPSTDASIKNGFATAAFRFGHTMIRSFFGSFSNTYANLGSDQLRDIFGNTHQILSNPSRNVDHYQRGLAVDPVQKVDRKLSPEVTRHLFANGPDAFDLAALNIQRGRDHGLDTYINYRRFCNKQNVKSFADLSDTHDASARSLLSTVYSSVEDIDLFTGVLTEMPLPGSLVGFTLSCLLGKQFKDLKEGDRFWFEENNDKVKFKPDQLDELRKASLSRVICDNTDTTTIQSNAFKIETRVSCESLPNIDLTKWKDPSSTWGTWEPWGSCDSYGIQRRVRHCEPCNCGCEGINAESRPCQKPFCKWSKWSPCKKHYRRRSRLCLKTQKKCCKVRKTKWVPWAPR